MFKLIEKFFRGIAQQTPNSWNHNEEEGSADIDITAMKQNILKSFAKGWHQEIECEDGWFELVANCHSELYSIDTHYTIFQIKQKFGTLRYYAEPSRPEYAENFRPVIDRYEQLSARTCEMTGAKGVLMKNSRANPRGCARVPRNQTIVMFVIGVRDYKCLCGTPVPENPECGDRGVEDDD